MLLRRLKTFWRHIEKEKAMKIYNTATQEAYDELMSELEEKGYEWDSGHKPTYFKCWSEDKEDTCIAISGKKLTSGSIKWYKKQHSNIPIIEYKAKGESMTQEEMKHKLQEVAFDISASIESFARGALAVEYDLQEAKMSAKNLIEKIDEYLESQKYEFKVGDYATFDIPNNKEIAKIEKIYGDKIHGLWYNTKSKNIEQDYYYFGSGTAVKHATPTEILEYEMALAFHKHGRKPFEVKEGDIVYLKGYDKNIFLDSGNIYKKHNFIDGDVGLVKTVEEINEWLENK